MSIKLKLGAVAFSLCALFASSAMADPVITQVQIDESTQGAWDGTYGSCYNVVPQASPRHKFPEIEIGPDFQRGNPGQYANPPEGIIASAVCIGGDADENFDVRIFSNALATPGDAESLPNHAFAFGFNEHNCEVTAEEDCAFMVREFTAQDNTCLGFPYPSTFDDEDVAFEPLSSEIKLVKGGDARIAYYFLSEDWQCRSQDYRLTINGLDVAGNNVGTVDDISVGKYVVFDITGIPDGATIRLDVTIGDPNCAGAPTTNGPNSHMSGIFVDGTDACLDPFCGDGNVDPDETCDPPGSEIDSPVTGPQYCTDSCNYCGDGYTDRQYEECDPTNPDDPNAKMCSDSCKIKKAPTRTKGYWKNHPTVIDGSCEDCPDNLVDPDLSFCGNTSIDTACEALYFLKMKGGGLNQFMSQGMAALLNCTAFGCPDKIRNIIADNATACDDGDSRAANGKSWSRVARKLDRFNNSNDSYPLPFQSPSALPKYYKEECN